MNQTNFLNWFENKLLKNLEEPSVIILDNAPYHSMIKNKIPNTMWRKTEIEEWLTTHQIQFDSTLFKKDLLKLVNE